MKPRDDSAAQCGADQDRIPTPSPAPDEQIVEIPDPNGPAQPVARLEKGMSLGAAATILLVAGGTAFHLLSAQVRTCPGATRSSKLVWEDRGRQIEEAINKEQGSPSANVKSPAQVEKTPDDATLE